MTTGVVGVTGKSSYVTWTDTNNQSSEMFGKLVQCILRDEPVIMQCTPVHNQLTHDLWYVPRIIYPTVLPAFKLHSKLLQHGCQIATVGVVKATEQLTHIYPLVGVGRKRARREDTLRKETVSDVPWAKRIVKNKTERSEQQRSI